MTDISAGLSISVVKNALYKVIRLRPAGARAAYRRAGRHILNDAVLRAFENELGVDVVRPDIAGLMGATARRCTPWRSARCTRARAPCSASTR